MQGGNSACDAGPLIIRPPTIYGLFTEQLNTSGKRGCAIVPIPQKTLRGDSFITHEGHLWELSLWLSGEPLSNRNSNSQQRRAAFESLADFHLAANSFDSGENKSQFGPPPGLLLRQKILANLLQGNLAELSQAVQLEPPSHIRETMAQMLRMIEKALPETLAAVEKCSRVSLPLQWCLRDVHPGNILITGKNVTGIIDFGATSFDSIAGDLARLIGGFDCGPIEPQELLKAYGKIRPLTVEERRTVGAYLVGGLISSAANWVRWLVVERSIPLANTTQARLAELARQLGQLSSWEMEDAERF